MWNHIKIVRIIKSLIPFELKLMIIRVLVFGQSIFYSYLMPKKDIKISKNKRNIFVLLSTDYSNLGDHAMTYAQIRMLKNKFRDCEVVEVLVGDTLKNMRYLSKNIKPDDVITLKGGGNIGIEYFREELIRRKILKSFPNNKIILFPQTVYFPKNRIGNKEFKNTINAFNNHNSFFAFFRDKATYDLMKNHINKNVFLTPDTVFSLGNIDIDNNKRSGIVTCLRSDVEGVYSEYERNELIEMLRKKFSNVTVTDTIKDYYINKEDREKELYDIWNLIGNCELLITDRLHGMIFAALTSTPCIVLKTYNHKLIGQYEWVKHLNYIEHRELNLEEMSNTIDSLINIDVIPLDSKLYDCYFEKLIECIGA